MSAVNLPKTDVEKEGVTPLPPHSSSPLTLHQFLYIFILNGLGAAILNGAVNFGLATAMYRDSDDITSTWLLPNSLAGDAAITVIVQGTLTWVIAGQMTRIDARHNRVETIPLLTPTKPQWITQVLFAGNFDFIAEDESTRVSRLLGTSVRGILFSASTGLVLWPASLVYLLAVYGNSGTIPNWPTPEIYTGVLGAVLGLLTTPVVVILALMEAHRLQHTTRLPTKESQSKTATGAIHKESQRSSDLTEPSVLEPVPHSSVDM